MAFLRDITNKATRISIKPLAYTQKEESWFSVNLAFIHEEKRLLDVEGFFHLNDFVYFIKNIKTLLQGKIDK